MKKSITIAIASVSFSVFGWSLFGISAKEVEKAVIENGVCSKGETLILSSVKATKTDRDGIWKVRYAVISEKQVPQYVNSSNNVTNVDHQDSKKQSLFVGFDDIRYETVKEKISYVSSVSASRKDGKVVLKFLKAE